jgi:zinc transporter
MAEPRQARAWLLDGRGGARRFAVPPPWRPEDGPLWIDLDENDPRDRSWLETGSGLRPQDRELFLQDSAWPRALVPAPETLLVFTREGDPAPGAAFDASVLFRAWIEPARLISMGPRELPELREVRRRLEGGQGPTTAREILLLLAETAGRALADFVFELHPALAQLELAMERSQPFPSEELRRLRRRAIARKHVVDPQRALLRRVDALERTWPNPENAHRWDALVDHYEEASRALANVVERTQALQEAAADRVADQMNRRIYYLTLFSTLLLPMSLVVGLFGVNLGTADGNIGGARDFRWFVGLCAVLAAVGGWIRWFLRRRFV